MTAAEQQAQAKQNIVRIAAALRERLSEWGYDLTEFVSERVVKHLLDAGVVRPVPPPAVDPPMTGQTEF